jgi:hypothetical protein
MHLPPQWWKKSRSGQCYQTECVNSWRMRVLPWVKKCPVLYAQILFKCRLSVNRLTRGGTWFTLTAALNQLQYPVMCVAGAPT